MFLSVYHKILSCHKISAEIALFFGRLRLSAVLDTKKYIYYNIIPKLYTIAIQNRARCPCSFPIQTHNGG